MSVALDHGNRGLVLEEIERAVSRAGQTHVILWVYDCAGRIAQTFPGSGLSPNQIAERLIRKAIAAGIAIELAADEPIAQPTTGVISAASPIAIAPSSNQSTARKLLRDEVGRIVLESKTKGEVLRVGYHAGMLAAAYPTANFSISRIMDEIILAASKAGIAVEMYRPKALMV